MCFYSSTHNVRLKEISSQGATTKKKKQRKAEFRNENKKIWKKLKQEIESNERMKVKKFLLSLSGFYL